VATSASTFAILRSTSIIAGGEAILAVVGAARQPARFTEGEEGLARQPVALAEDVEEELTRQTAAFAEGVEESPVPEGVEELPALPVAEGVEELTE